MTSIMLRVHEALHQFLAAIALLGAKRSMADPGSEEGQGMIEYALILVLIAVAVIVVLTTLGGQVKNVFASISCGIGGSCPPH